MLLQVSYLPVVNLSVGVLNFTLVNQIILFPLSSYNFARGEDQGPLTVELVAQTVPDVLVAVEKNEVSFDFDTVLVEASEDYSVAVVYFCLSLYLVVLQVSKYFISVAVVLG